MEKKLKFSREALFIDSNICSDTQVDVSDP